MKLFTAIVALAGLSSATASLRGGAVLPSDMKDLLSKLVAADEGTATCPALVGQMCKTAGGVVLGDCPADSSCNFVGANNLGNWQHATVPGYFCSQPTVEAELVEESEELQDPACKVLGPDNGGCTPTSSPGLSCKPGYVCEGYSQDSSLQNANLGKCVSVNTNRDHTPTHAQRCNAFYNQNHSCDTTADCSNEDINPIPANGYRCEARCDDTTRQCVSPTFEEEEEELAASADGSSDDLPLDAKHCLVTTEAQQFRCTWNDNQEEIPTQGKKCCSMTVESDGTRTYSHSGVTCDYFGSNPNNVLHGDTGPGTFCRINDGEDLAVN